MITHIISKYRKVEQKEKTRNDRVEKSDPLGIIPEINIWVYK